MYNFRLGRTPIGSNLITNGDFSAGAAGWTFGGNWTLVGTDANYVHPGGAWGNLDTLSQANVFTVGKWYRISWDVKTYPAANQEPFMAEYCGTYGSKMRVYDDFDLTGSAPIVATYTVDRLCLAGTDFSIKTFAELIFPAATYYSFTNFTVYELDYNEAVINPAQWQESNKVLKRSDLVDGIYVSYISSLSFFNDGYDYLYQDYLDNGLCSKVPIKIEYVKPNGDIEDYFEGIIYQSECNYKLWNKTVDVAVEDVATSLLIQKGRDRKVRFEAGTNINKLVFSPDWWGDIMPDPRITVAFNDGAGGYATYTNRRAYTIFEIFQRIVLWATDFEVLPESTLLTSGTFDNFALSYGKVIRLGIGSGLLNIDSKTFNISFEEMINELNNLMPIGFRTYSNSGVPTISIESRDDLFGVATSFTISDIGKPEFNFKRDELYQTIEIGYENYDEDNKPFVRGSFFMVADTCGESKLTLVSKFVQDSATIYSILAGSTSFDEYLFWMEINAAGTQTKNGAAPNYDYNDNITVNDNMTRWLDFLQAFNRGTDNQKNFKTNNSFLREFNFAYPISKSDFDTISSNPFSIINIAGKNLTATDSYIEEISLPMNCSNATFKLLAQ